uniref:Uncharacterized protein n=1 Tax=Eptatretus burgeri TaxID=7764 RepID=A0A8C4NJ82_EPTBU
MVFFLQALWSLVDKGRSFMMNEEPSDLHPDPNSSLSETELLSALRSSRPIRTLCRQDSLNLSGLSLSPDDCSQLAKAAQNGKAPTRLMLVDCHLNAEGLKPLAQALIYPQQLCLSRNAIGNDGARLVCDALCQKDCRIQDLGLCGNQLTDDIVPHLCNAIRRNESLQNVWLWDNHFNDKEKHDLKGLEFAKSKLEIHV